MEDVLDDGVEMGLCLIQKQVIDIGLVHHIV